MTERAELMRIYRANGIYKAIDSKKAFGGNMFPIGGYTA